jgi:hypothetical protein
LDGVNSDVKIAFDALNAGTGGMGLANILLFFLSGPLPILNKIPTKRRIMVDKMSALLGEISASLFERSKLDEADPRKVDRSLLGTLS